MQKSNSVSGQVVPLFSGKRIMSDQITSEVLGYWERLRKGALVPQRSQIDPRQFRYALQNIFILEASDLDNIRIRLSSTKLNDIMGMELRGMPAYALFAPDHRSQLNLALKNCLQKPQITKLTLAPYGTILLLPMTNDDGEINRVLGVITDVPSYSTTPARFKITSVKHTRIVATKPTLQAPVLELAESKANFEHQIKRATPKGPPDLKIVK